MAANPWFSLDYLRRSWPDLLAALAEHIWITLAAMALAIVVAVPLSLIAVHVRFLTTPTLVVSAFLYTVPALALITGLWPVFGLTSTTVIVALALYALLIIVRNGIVGLREAPPEVMRAATAMGYSRVGRLMRVAFPLAAPSYLAGIRVATVSTIGLVMIGALVGHGGLGSIVLNGFTNNFYRAPIVAGLVLTVALALLFDAALIIVQRRLTAWNAGAVQRS